MSSALLTQIATALARFTSETRLYELTFGDDDPGLLVEAFAADDAVQVAGMRDVIALSTDAHIALDALLGRQATLEVSLSDGTRSRFNGDVIQAALLGSEGGFARYRLRLAPWMWRLTQVRSSRVWQDRSVIEIVDEVFGAYGSIAQWRWSEEAPAFMSTVAPRSYCCQYRESDHDFVQRLLAEEGLGWRVEQVEDGHRVVLFADTTQDSAIPEDASSVAGGGIRFHGARAGEQQDTIQALQRRRTLAASLSTVLSYDYKAKKAVGASVPSSRSHPTLPSLEQYDTPGQYAWTNAAEAQHYARLRMEAREAESVGWHGRSTVRTFAAGTRVAVTQGPLAQASDGSAPALTLLKVTSVGVNNLPSAAAHGLAELFGPIPELLEQILREADTAIPDMQLVVAQARDAGYANAFEAIAADVPWRPAPRDTGAKPTAAGAQSAIVIGADGQDQPGGADELYCDALGRVRIRFHWQDEGNASCWVRVAQRTAGGGMGSQFLPRIGQEVLVQFIENDIDRPIVVGALYNGQGEGGTAPTPGGASDADDAGDMFSQAADHAPSAQGNLAAGNSPVWHGAAAGSDGHNNAASQWGVRSKEFGGQGYNQLLFDDTDAQGRVQLRSTHAMSELTLGHLVHAADNYRGSLRGQGGELRTDAYGAVRAGAGLLVSSYGIDHGADTREPAGDNTAGIALLKQAVKLGETFDQAAKTHQTVGLAVHEGVNKANASALDGKAAPLQAMLTAVSGMVDAQGVPEARAAASGKTTAPGDDKLPHATDPVVAISARAGLSATAGQAVQLSNGETIALMSGADSQFIGGAAMRMQAGQAIGVLGGAVGAGAEGIGMQAVAAQDAIEVQAQADTMSVQARDDLAVISANASAEWAAAKSISLSTAGGANITIEGGNITVQCPGKLTVHAGKKSFIGPERMDFRMPYLPVSNAPAAFSQRLDVHDLFVQHDFGAISYAAKVGDKKVMRGTLDEHGRSPQIYAEQGQEMEILTGRSLDEWDLIVDYDDLEKGEGSPA